MRRCSDHGRDADAEVWGLAELFETGSGNGEVWGETLYYAAAGGEGRVLVGCFVCCGGNGRWAAEG